MQHMKRQRLGGKGIGEQGPLPDPPYKSGVARFR